MEEPKPRRRISSFLDDEPTPADQPDPVADLVAPPVTVELRAPRPTPPRIKPQALVGEYPWSTPFAVARADLRKQFPLRLHTMTDAKLQYLSDVMAVRSKASFVESAVVAAVDDALMGFLMSKGMSEEEARAAIIEPEASR